MIFRICISALLSALCCALASCSPGNPVPPAPSTFTVLKSGSSIGITAPAGSADAFTAVTITSGGTGNGTAAGDGSVAFNGTATGGSVTLSYSKSGQALTTDSTVQALETRVTAPLFSTGSAPNDMELADSALFVANALDNTTVRYGLDGVVQDTLQFDEFAGPAFLTVAGDTLYVVTNGSNELRAVQASDFDTAVISNALFDTTGQAFLAPGKPALVNDSIFIPRSAITGFGPPTTYGDNILEIRNLEADNEVLNTLHAVEARNGAYVAYSAARGEVYLSSGGEQQFDEDFHPFVTTNSHLTIMQADGTPVTTLDLGKIGATTIALSRTGDIAYLGNLLTGDIYKVDLSSRTILRGESNPIHLTDAFTYVSDLEFVPNSDLLLATSFNTDELYVIDTVTDMVSPAPYPGPFQVSPDPELLAGAICVEADATGHAYVLLSIANSVAKVDLLP